MKLRIYPWLNERCEEAIRKKNATEGKAEFRTQQAECSKVMAEEYQKHLAELKLKIEKLKKYIKEIIITNNYQTKFQLYNKAKQILDGTDSIEIPFLKRVIRIKKKIHS